ncbi:MAG: hypothetical protein H7177_16205 [Rhizobacter sp.]|nr:hypothetical protein [Bacteriovorax sp.]
MKFQSSLLIITTFTFLLTTTTHARDIILVENLGTQESGQTLLKILQKKFNIPRKLIHYMNKQTCEKNSDAIMQLCLKADGEMEIVKINKYVMEQTMGVFLESEETI